MSNAAPSDADPFGRFFERLTGLARPYGYQRRLAEQEGWPDLLDVPTGLGKTAAVVVSWLWKRLAEDPQTGRRLVYCLPMRTLVEQTREAATKWCTAAAPLFGERGLEPPQTAVLMGGESEAEWDLYPDRPYVIVGTQDMLLSRALCRGYGMGRYRWPMHFGLLSSDCLWVFDETQLMGVGVETSAQLQAFREVLGTRAPARSLWMSATLGREQLATVDHPEPPAGWAVHGLLREERAEEEAVRERTLARKRLIRADDFALDAEPGDDDYGRLAERLAAAATERGGLTLAVVNRVDRAREIYRALRQVLSPNGPPPALLHSRFRPADRVDHERLLKEEGDRVVVSTQVVEAGVDVSARTLFTELAPWPSLVQRFGRCNRYGEAEKEGWEAEIHWIPLAATEEHSALALPYEPAELARAVELLERLAEQGGDAGPESLAAIPYQVSPAVRPVLRRRDLLDLFDTSPDLLGYDLDVSRFVRDGEDSDLQVFWRDFTLADGRPPTDLASPERHELCRVSIATAAGFFGELEKTRRRLRSSKKEAAANLLRAWRWDPLAEGWEVVRRPRPGERVLLHATAGGYDSELGWTGERDGDAEIADLSGKEEPPGAGAEPAQEQPGANDSMGSDHGSSVGRWVRLTDHLDHVEARAKEIAGEISLDDRLATALASAALWHDVGKAHEQFQRRLLGPLEEHPERDHPGPGPWAKSDHRLRAKGVRRYFRHELVSALAWLAHHPAGNARDRDLVAFLIASHHGKVRLALSSIPEEEEPEVPDTLFACGVWHGDVLPAVELPGGRALPPTRLDLSPMRMGEGSWTERLLALRDDPHLGPFRLAYLETLLRAADGRASRAEKEGPAPEEDARA